MSESGIVPSPRPDSEAGSLRQQEPPGSEPSPRERGFAFGALVGFLSAAVLAVVLVYAAMIAGGYELIRIFGADISALSPGPSYSSNTRWIVLDKSARGTIHGVVEYGVVWNGDANTGPGGPLGTVVIAAPSVQSGVDGAVKVQIDLMPTTKIIRSGKPWDPPGNRASTPVDRLLALYTDDSPALDITTDHPMVTISVHRNPSSRELEAESCQIGPTLSGYDNLP